MRDPAVEILSAFARGVTLPSSWPVGVRVAHGDVASRFAVYRNNVAVARIGAFCDLFPVTRRLVGDAFFRGLVRTHLEKTPPISPIVATWGDGFVAGLELDPAAAEFGWLVDVARLEAAWISAYHAAEAEPVEVTELLGRSPEELLTARVDLHPSLRIVASPHPVGAIWSAHQGDAEPGPLGHHHAETVVVVRPRAEVAVRVIGPAECRLLERLAAGVSLGEAGEAAATVDPAFDVGGGFVALVMLGVITGFT